MSSLLFTPTASGGTGWINNANIVAEDAVYATATAAFSSTPNLLVSLNLLALPDTAVVNGLQVEIKGSSSGAGNATPIFEFNDGNSLLKNYGSVMTTTNAWYVFGGPTDLWGQASILPSRLKNIGAEWRFRASNSSGFTENVYVDFVRVTIYYTDAGVSQNMSGMLMGFSF